MFKSARWRSDKSKIKAIFKLQFQATQVPKMKKSTLTLSLVPEDLGKPTAKLEKARVLDGTCSWENPIYETVKFTRESKTGELHEKIYYFIVSSGSSKSGFIGEVWINLADYAEAIIPSTVSLLLSDSESSAILHVTIQRMQEAGDQRYEEDGSISVLSQTRSLDNKIDGCHGHYAMEDEYFKRIQNHNKEDMCNGSSSKLSSRSDGVTEQSTHQVHSSSTLDAAESPRKQNSLPGNKTVDSALMNNYMHQRSCTEWSVGSTSDGSMAESTNSPENKFARERAAEASVSYIEKLRSEISFLVRQAEVTELEMQSLRKQITKENSRGHDLSRQIVGLQEEREALKSQCQELRSMQKENGDKEAINILKCENEESRTRLEEIGNTELQMQLQKMQDSNSELVAIVRELDEMLGQKEREIYDLSRKMENSRNSKDVQEEVDGDWHAQAKEVESLKQKLKELHAEIEFYKKEREELKTHMEQFSLDYENLKKENHNISSKLENHQLQEEVKLKNHCSNHLDTIKELEAKVVKLETDKKKGEEQLSVSLNTIQELKIQVEMMEKELKKQEERASEAEEFLRKTRCENAAATERFQEEFERLSVEMASKLDDNEKLRAKATSEANDLRLQNTVLEEKLEKTHEEFALAKDQYLVGLQELSNQIELKENQIKKIQLQLDDKSKQFELAKENEREKHEAFSMEIRMLRDEIEGLRKEKNGFSLSRDNTEKIQKFNNMRSSKIENEQANGSLLAEVESLRAQMNKLRDRLSEEELEKRNLSNELTLLKDELQKERNFVQTSRQDTPLEILKNAAKKKCNPDSKEVIKLKEKIKLLQEAGNIRGKKLNCSGISTTPIMSVRHGTGRSPVKSEFVTSSEEELKHCGLQSNYECDAGEVASLRERNKCMESELKDMQERYSEISLKFAEVEGERQQLIMQVRNLKNRSNN